METLAALGLQRLVIFLAALAMFFVIGCDDESGRVIATHHPGDTIETNGFTPAGSIGYDDENDRLVGNRQGRLEIFVSDFTINCLVCVSDADCMLGPPPGRFLPTNNFYLDQGRLEQREGRC